MDRRFTWGRFDWRVLRRASALVLGHRVQALPSVASAQAAPSVGEISTRVTDTLPAFERVCVAGGEKLETLCNGSTQFVADCAALLEIAGGRIDGQSLAQATLELLQGPFSYLDFCHDRHDELLRRLAACEERTQSMIDVRTRMHTTLAPLTYMTVLFKIESATLPEEFRETFQNVTTEIDRMRQLVDETFTKNAELLANAHATLAEVRALLENEFRSQFAHIAQRRREIDEAIRRLDGQLVENAGRHSDLRRQSEAIAAEISQIVQSLQFQDIVQQKSDHVIEAMSAWQNEPPSQHLVRLQALQLEGVVHDLENGYHAVSTSLGRIRTSIDRFGENTRQLGTLADMASPTGMVKSLLDCIAEAHAMILGLTATTDRSHEAVRPAGELASSLSSTLIELSTNMRLIALNAQIRSVQIGDLTGLETLASRTASISHEIDDVSEENSRSLAALRQDLDALFAMFEDFRRIGREQITSLEAARPAVEARLHTLRQQATSSQQTVEASIAALQSCARDFDTTFSELPALSAEIAAAAASLHTLSETLPASDAADLHAHSGRYTMAAEHATHAAFLGATASAAVAETAETPPVFFDLSPDASAAPAENGATDDFTSPAEPEPMPPAAEKDPKPPESTPPGLGSNVELF